MKTQILTREIEELGGQAVQKVDVEKYQLVFTSSVEEAINELGKNGFALEHATLNQFLEEPY